MPPEKPVDPFPGENQDFKKQLKSTLLSALAEQGLPSSSSLEDMEEKEKELQYRRSLLRAIIEMSERELQRLQSMNVR